MYEHVSVVLPVHVVLPPGPVVCGIVFDWHGLGAHDPAENSPLAWHVIVPLPMVWYPPAHVYAHVSPVTPVHVVLPPGPVVCGIVFDWHGLGAHDPAENSPLAWHVMLAIVPLPMVWYPPAHVYAHVFPVTPVHVVVPLGSVVCATLVDRHDLAEQAPSVNTPLAWQVTVPLPTYPLSQVKTHVPPAAAAEHG